MKTFADVHLHYVQAVTPFGRPEEPKRMFTVTLDD
jgi:hypothetical protein